MTEAEWLGCSDPVAMVKDLMDHASERKLRLFGCACSRCVWDLLAEESFRRAVEIAERFADDRATKKELAAAKKESGAALERNGLKGITGPAYWAMGAAWSTTRTPVGSAAMYPLWSFTTEPERQRQVALLLELFGNPFRPYAAPSHWPATVVGLAQALYDGQDNRLILADGLEEAGHAELAEHFRAEEWHPKGCWVMDMILGKA